MLLAIEPHTWYFLFLTRNIMNVATILRTTAASAVLASVAMMMEIRINELNNDIEKSRCDLKNTPARSHAAKGAINAPNVCG